MKTVEFINGDKIKIETGLKIFDKQTNLITTGSAYCNTQQSMIVRPYYNTTGDSQEGALQKYDLAFFKANMPGYVESQVRKLAENREVYVYEFFHTNNKKKKVVHGYVVTTKDHEYLNHFIVGPTQKSYGVVQECAKYVSDYNSTHECQKRMAVV